MKKCVFLLEDNDDLRELVIYLLEEEHYEVLAYATATSFLDGISKQLPDVAVLDIMLPDGNGLEICADLKKDSRTKDLPIIMMSAHKEATEVAERCKGADFISKPFDIDEFVARVNRQTGQLPA